MVIGTLAAYAIVRLTFRGRQWFARGAVVTYLVPGSLLFIPMFQVIYSIGLIDNIVGLMVTYLTFTVPFATWMMIGYFRNVPIELEDAALVDGCSRLQALVRIMVPDCAARAGGGRAVRVHAVVERVSVRAGLYRQRLAEDAHRGPDRPGARRHLPVGADDGRGAAGRAAADTGLHLLAALGGLGPGGGGRQRLEIREEHRSMRPTRREFLRHLGLGAGLRPAGRLCSQPAAAPTRRARAKPAAGATAAPAAAGAAASKSNGTKLTIWGWQSFTPEGDKALGDQMKEWGTANKTEVEYVVVENAQFPQKLAAAIEAKAPPGRGHAHLRRERPRQRRHATCWST